MSKIDDYIETVILEQEDELRALCSPLKYLEIDGFSYSKVYDNGRFITLTTNVQWAQYHFNQFFNKQYSPSDIQTTLQVNDTPLWIANPDNKIWQQAKAFNLNNAIILTKRQKNYREIFCYTSNLKNDLGFYLNNHTLLQDFTFIFKENTQQLIKKAEANSLHTPNHYLSSAKKNIIDENSKLHQHFYQTLKPQRIYLNDTQYLTTKEIACLRWCVKGKTAAEIGLLLGITKRTVESYLEKIKLKFDCYKITDLPRRATELGIINLIMNTE